MKIIISFLLTLIITTNLYTQNAVYTVPSVLIFNNTHFKDTSIEIANLTDSFRPIGFSKTGNFAYVLEPADEACGCYFFEIFILNKQNKVLWHYKYSDENKYQTQRVLEDRAYANIDTVWLQYNTIIQKKLNHYQIIQQNNWKITQLPIKNGSPNLFYTSYPQFYNSVDFGKMVKKYTLYQSKKVNGKTIKSKVYEQQIATWEKDRKIWFSMVLNVTTVGYINNPVLKNHGIYIHHLLQRGWEGTPYVESLTISNKNK
jgi:hypothetical protein